MTSTLPASTPWYSGSELLRPVSSHYNIPLDQINFIVSQMTALLLSFAFRRYLACEKVSPKTRHWASLIPGVALSYFCFGQQMVHLLALGSLSYIAIFKVPPAMVQRVVLPLTVAYLSYLHISRLILDYGGYTIDVTGPIMIAVQRASSLAFSINDGMVREEGTLTPEQKRYSVKRKPTPLEFFGYFFQFQSLICGPLVYFKDYMEFIERQDVMRHVQANNNKPARPSPSWTVIQKLSSSLFCLILVLVLVPKYPMKMLVDDHFLAESSFLTITYYMLICTSMTRIKYYHAWKLGEGICNASGIGFNGWTPDNRPKWNLISNVDIINVETSLNMRTGLESWNKTTQTWLKRYAYDRTSRHKTVLTYTLSALWHGFYPGYYLTFLTAALATEAARSVRRCVRPRFQSNPAMARAYDLVTCITTRLMLAYLIVPFHVLGLKDSFKFFYRVYFCGHFLCIVAAVVLPIICSQKRETREKVKAN